LLFNLLKPASVHPKPLQRFACFSSEQIGKIEQLAIVALLDGKRTRSIAARSLSCQTPFL